MAKPKVQFRIHPSGLPRFSSQWKNNLGGGRARKEAGRELTLERDISANGRVDPKPPLRPQSRAPEILDSTFKWPPCPPPPRRDHFGACSPPDHSGLLGWASLSLLPACTLRLSIAALSAEGDSAPSPCLAVLTLGRQVRGRRPGGRACFAQPPV